MRLDDLRPTENAGKASATFDAPYKNWNTIQSLSIAATSAPVLDAKGHGRAGRLTLKKFPQLAGFVSGGAERIAIFRLTLSVISIPNYTMGFGHAELVAV
ncbi:MAG TPA: hypothetical protein VG891_14585 [Rhizomicrobium sp.]|nr:hypothetical protein [Rhizomicrobium sp.]